MERYLNATEELLSNGSPLSAYVLQRASGTSKTSVFLLRDVFKVGPAKSVHEEYEVYCALRDGLGDHTYYAMFPRVAMLKAAPASDCVMEVEWLGEQLHAFCESVRSSPEIPPASDIAIERKLEVVDDVVKQALSHLEVLFQRTHFSDRRLASECIQELLRTLAACLRRSKHHAVLSRDIPVIKSRAECLVAGVVCSLSHRDTVTDNIYFRKLPGSHDVVVKFADPLRLLPYLNAKDFKDLERAIAPAHGCLSMDLAALWVALYREERELRQISSNIRLTAYRTVQDTASRWIEQGRFSGAVFDLSLATRFALYVACRCEYCTAPVRKWLYDDMVVQCKARLASCAVASLSV